MKKSQKIAIIGSPGSGKSTVAKRLHELLKLPLIHLDKNFLRENWQTTPVEEWQQKVKDFVAQPKWIIDGDYFSTMDLRLAAADTIVYFDVPRFVCLWRITKRAFTASKSPKRTDLPQGCEENLDRNFLKFFKFVWNYHSKRKPLVKAKLKQYAQSKQVFVIKNNKDVELMITKLLIQSWNPKAVIFDFDGVIINSEKLHFEACNKALNGVGVKLTYKHYLVKYVGLSDAEFFPKVLQDNNLHSDAADFALLIQEKIEIYIDLIEKAEILPFVAGCEQYIKSLSKQGNKLAIFSVATKKEVMAVLSHASKDLRKYFDVIVTFEDVSKGKPDPEGYLLAAKRLNVQPAECLVIEDTAFGVQAARAAGMHVIAVLTTCSDQQLSNADKIIRNFSELL